MILDDITVFFVSKEDVAYGATSAVRSNPMMRIKSLEIRKYGKVISGRMNGRTKGMEELQVFLNKHLQMMYIGA